MADVERVCGAQLRGKPGRYCRRLPSEGRTRCKLHGGASPVGAAHPSFVHGKYSSSLPEHLATKYQAAREDPSLVQLRDELALTEVMLIELLETRRDGVGDIQAARRAFDRVEASMRAKDLTGAAIAMQETKQAFARTLDVEALEGRILDTITTRRKLVDSETKRLKTLHQMMTNEQAMALVGGLVAAVQAEVTDRVALARITTRFRALLSAEHKAAA
jgi:hypothetical protein